MKGIDRGLPLEPEERRGNGSAPKRREPRLRIEIATLYHTPPHELLARFSDGDPLDLEVRCEARRDQLAYLVSRRRLFLRAMARAAYSGHTYRGKPPVEVWLEGLIDRSLQEILEEDDAGTRSGVEVEKPENYGVFAEHLRIDVSQARAVCSAFNELAPDVRRTFFAITIERNRVEEFAKTEQRPVDVVMLQLGRAAAVLTRFGTSVAESPKARAPTGTPLGNWPTDW